MTKPVTTVQYGGADASRSAHSPTAPISMVARIATLRTLGVEQLRDEYLAAFGEPTRSRNREWLFRSVAWQIQALAEGGLTERAKRRVAELARDCDVRPRRDVPKPSAPDEPKGATRIVTMPPVRGAGQPLPGSTLVRAYKGREIRVRVRDGDFEYEGRSFRSLTAIAEAVTGAHWSGTLFFGLNKTAKKEPQPSNHFNVAGPLQPVEAHTGALVLRAFA